MLSSSKRYISEVFQNLKIYFLSLRHAILLFSFSYLFQIHYEIYTDPINSMVDLKNIYIKEDK